MSKSRLERSLIAEQYELPAFAAGMVMVRIEHILQLLTARATRFADDAYIVHVREEAVAAMDQIRVWQARAQEMTGYPEHWRRG